MIFFNKFLNRDLCPILGNTSYFNQRSYKTYNLSDHLQTGPNLASLNDFWKMVWEQEVSVIVMTTNLVEKSKVNLCNLF